MCVFTCKQREREKERARERDERQWVWFVLPTRLAGGDVCRDQCLIDALAKPQ